MLILRRFVFGILLFSFILPSGTLLLPQSASGAAFGLVPCALKENNPATDWNETGPCTLCHFLIGMNFVVKLLRNIMTACAIAVIVAMAIVYITSAGDEGRMTFAKTGIKYSLIGFIVILLAWVMVNFIFTLPIFATNGLVRTGWDTFTCNTNSQVSWAAPKAASGIGNATGNVGSGQPGRESLPGSTPPSGGASCNGNGVCETGETCATCAECCAGGGEDPPAIPNPKCGGAHYECDNGTASDTQELTDRWVWICKEDYDQQYCFERFNGCGDGKVSGVNQYGNPETCDEGGRNGFCGEPGVTCDINACTRCDGSGPPAPVPLSCGPSNGTSSAPVAPLCLGDGAIASSVTTSAVGSASRYDWTCTQIGLVGSFACASGAISVGGGATATCGVAQQRSWINPPTESDGLCATGSLTIYGVTPLVHAVTGEPLWYWSCQIGTGVATSCYAPRIVAGNNGGMVGNAACGTVVNRSSGVDFPLLCSRGTVVGPSLDCRGDSTGTMINCSWTCKANDSEYTTSCSGTAPVVGG